MPGAPLTVEQLEAKGEQRAIHRRSYNWRKPVPKRPRMLDKYEAQIRQWLAAQPGITAVDVLQRLQDVASAGTFTSNHLQTVQRASRSGVLKQSGNGSIDVDGESIPLTYLSSRTCEIHSGAVVQ